MKLSFASSPHLSSLCRAQLITFWLEISSYWLSQLTLDSNKSQTTSPVLQFFPSACFNSHTTHSKIHHVKPLSKCSSSDLASTAQEEGQSQDPPPNDPPPKTTSSKRKLASHVRFGSLQATVADLRSEMVVLISIVKELVSPPKKHCIDGGKW